MKKYKIAVAGTGYVGLSIGNRFICYGSIGPDYYVYLH